ncbi:hypothetical protein A7U43_19905 [Mycobacterium adipatum]|uniref:Uncharacterized protein n=1 Tax=Mycobacterium adipatum TaxID=1682113 RepID=A0A172UPT2_9MYCO|nr:hypothetical protein A7U43_19905 [Mycobacterium adipatum]
MWISGSSGSSMVLRHHSRRTNSPSMVVSSTRNSSSSNGSDGAGPGGPVRSRVSGCAGIDRRAPCSGPASGAENDTAAVLSSRPCWRVSTRRATAVRPS